jgi:cytochrome b
MDVTPRSFVQKSPVRVWDPFVRIMHWALVAAFAIAFLTAEEERGSPAALHVWGGYTIGVIVALRVLWGFAGTRYARFSSFVCGPGTALRYLGNLFIGRARRHLGHSPAGGAMAIALLASLAATVVTGLAAYGQSGKGPLAAAGPAVVARAYADSDEHRKGASGERENSGEGLVGEAHSALANITLGLVVLHVLGVGLASFAHRENLVAAMINGRKRAEDAD